MSKRMRMPKVLTLVALACLTLVPAARAQRASMEVIPRQDSLYADLNVALEIALSESPLVQIADKEIVKTEYARKETRSALLPNLAATGSYNRTIQKQTMSMNFGDAPSTIKVGSDNSWSGGLSLSLPLIAPALWKTMQLTELDIDLAVESARASRIDLINSVKTAYYNLLMARDSYDVLLASYNNAEFNARIASDKYAQGVVSEFDKLRADVQWKNLKPQVISAENAIRLADMQLKVLMGVDVNEPISFVGALADYEQEMNQDMGYFAADTSLEENTNLRQLEIQADQLEVARRIIRAGNLPTLALAGSYQWTSLNDNFKIGNYQWFPYSYVALSLNIPIYAGGEKRYQEAQNRITQQQLELQREETVRNLELGVQNSLNEIEKSLEELESNRESVNDAERAFAISQRRYEIGSGNLLELNDSELALTTSRLSYNQSIYNYLAARASLEATLGRAVEPSAYTPSISNRK